MNTKKINILQYHEVSKEHAKALLIKKEIVFGVSYTNPTILVVISSIIELNEFVTFYIS